MNKEKESACQELRKAIGAEKVRDDEITLVTYCRVCHGFDTLAPFREPSFVVFPEAREDVVKTLKLPPKISSDKADSGKSLIPWFHGG